MLDGYKTYIFGAWAIIAVILKAFGVIDDQTLFVLLGIFLPAEGMALRRAITVG